MRSSAATWRARRCRSGGSRIDSFDAADYERWFATYNGGTRPEDLDWARWDNTKPGLERSGAVSRTWSPRLGSVHAGRRDDAEVVVISLGPPEDLDASSPVAWPAEVVVELRVAAADPRRSRWSCPGATSPLRAGRSPRGGPSRRRCAHRRDWRMRKLGVAVSPGDVVSGGGRHLHVVERLDHPGATVELLDSGLVAPGAPRPLRWDDAPVDRFGGLVAVRARQPVGHELRDVGPGRCPVPDPDQGAGGLSSSSRSSTEPTSQPAPTGRSTPR